MRGGAHDLPVGAGWGRVGGGLERRVGGAGEGMGTWLSGGAVYEPEYPRTYLCVAVYAATWVNLCVAWCGCECMQAQDLGEPVCGCECMQAQDLGEPVCGCVCMQAQNLGGPVCGCVCMQAQDLGEPVCGCVCMQAQDLGEPVCGCVCMQA